MNILLVDDNVFVLEGLEAGIDYAALGIEQVFTARSMKEAVRLLTTEEILLVLTDIEMPNGTGLELLEWINQHKPDTVAIFCTSYADFDYAQKAVELHSFGYYLKPICYEELQELLERAVKEVATRRKQRENEQHGAYWEETWRSRKKLFWQEVLLAIDSFQEDELNLYAQSLHIPYTVDDSFALCLLQFEKGKNTMERFTKTLENFVLTNVWEELMQDSAFTLETILKYRSGMWVLVFYLTSMESGEKTVSYVVDRIVSYTARITHCLLNGYYGIRVLTQTRDVFLQMETLAQEEEGEIHNRVMDVDFSHGKSCTPQPMSREEIRRIVGKTKEYIDSHFCEMITREELGKVANFSAGYLEKIFKAEIGKSMGNYMIDKRIERARELLSEGKLNVSEVSVAVGYDNFTYFARLFKNRVGISPRCYRGSIIKKNKAIQDSDTEVPGTVGK